MQYLKSASDIINGLLCKLTIVIKEIESLEFCSNNATLMIIFGFSVQATVKIRH